MLTIFIENSITDAQTDIPHGAIQFRPQIIVKYNKIKIRAQKYLVHERDYKLTLIISNPAQQMAVHKLWNLNWLIPFYMCCVQLLIIN